MSETKKQLVSNPEEVMSLKTSEEIVAFWETHEPDESFSEHPLVKKWDENDYVWYLHGEIFDGVYAVPMEEEDKWIFDFNIRKVMEFIAEHKIDASKLSREEFETLFAPFRKEEK